MRHSIHVVRGGSGIVWAVQAPRTPSAGFLLVPQTNGPAFKLYARPAETGGRSWLRTSDLSLARRNRTVALRRLVSPVVPASWTIHRRASPCVAGHLPPLALRLAPGNLVSLVHEWCRRAGPSLQLQQDDEPMREPPCCRDLAARRTATAKGPRTHPIWIQASGCAETCCALGSPAGCRRGLRGHGRGETKVWLSSPMPVMLLVSISPGRRKRWGVRPMPTPAGVPV
jgi:hypothetical protein